MSKPQTLLFFGPSGAGKGTQVDLLMDYLKKRSSREIIYMEMGALLRALTAEDSKSAELTKEIISNGRLMPGFLPNYLFTKQLIDNFTGDEHVIADAVVRRVAQAQAYDDAMVFYGREDYAVIYIEISDGEVLKRLLNRARSDDTEEKILRRIDWYKKDVMPALDTLRERGRTVHMIDGERTIEEIHKDILERLHLS